MKVTEISKESLKNIRPLIDAVLEPLGEGLGIKFHAGNCSFNARDFTFKLNGRLPDGEGEFAPKEHSDFKVGAWTLGLDPEDLGKEFRFDGKIYFIDGLKPRATKYQILGKGANGKRYKFKARDVKEGLC
jgi:hypothetical protein